MLGPGQPARLGLEVITINKRFLWEHPLGDSPCRSLADSGAHLPKEGNWGGIGDFLPGSTGATRVAAGGSARAWARPWARPSPTRPGLASGLGPRASGLGPRAWGRAVSEGGGADPFLLS
jgi:hypothetical protein